jgi:DNA-binding XRE family transcriptional regulator
MQNRLQELRNARQLSRKELARFLDVSYETIWRWEKDQMDISTPSLLKIATFFHVTLDDILPMPQPVALAGNGDTRHG